MLNKFLLKLFFVGSISTSTVVTFEEGNVVQQNLKAPFMRTKSILLDKKMSKEYTRKGNYEQSLELFEVDLKKETGLTDQEIYTSKITFSFTSDVWNQSSDALGWKGPAQFDYSLSYMDWMMKGASLTFDNPELIRKTKNSISSIQRNILTIDFEKNVINFNISSSIKSDVVWGGHESNNNHGWTRTGIKSITIQYIGW